MPVERRRVDLSDGQPQIVTVAGQRITGLSVIRVPRGVVFGVKFGNSPMVEGFSGRQTFVISENAPASDVREGVQIQGAAPAPGQSMDVMVSFWSGGA